VEDQVGFMLAAAAIKRGCPPKILIDRIGGYDLTAPQLQRWPGSTETRRCFAETCLGGRLVRDGAGQNIRDVVWR